MRLDMSHVIVERPRRSGGRARKGRVLAHDDLPSHEGIRRPHANDRKSFNEHLNPLKRFLHSQVGRPWDAVSHARIPAGPLFDQPSAWRRYRWTYPDRRYVVIKRRLSRAELRRHRLVDQPPAF